MATKIIKALVDGVVQNIEVEDIISPEQPFGVEERVGTLEDKHDVIITDGNFLVGNGTTDLEEMTPKEALEHINGATIATMTTSEYEALEETNANTLYMLIDVEEEKYATEEQLNSKVTELNTNLDELQKEIDDYHTSVKKYGAVGDGVTDDTQAFKNALAENDNVYVPKGDYLITDTLDISNEKSLYSDDGQRARIHYNGSNSVINVGRLSVFRNINITIKNAFSGIVFDTNNYNRVSNSFAQSSRVEHSNVKFGVASPNATLIGITVDSGTDANNKPNLTGLCYQTYRDIHIEDSSRAYGYGIKMELVQGRPFTEENKAGFPWITHISFDDINLGSPYTGIKSLVTNTSGAEHFSRISIGHILFNNVYTQCTSDGSTRYFLDLENFSGYFTKCIGWDYHNYGYNGEKVNIIGENVTASFNDCEMEFGAEFLKSCDFTAETNTDFTVEDAPSYFINKYFGGTFLKEGYDSVDAKIDAKMSSEYIGNIAEEKINKTLYEGYANVLKDPRVQYKIGQYYSNSSKTWKSSPNNTIVIIPIVKGGNVIRWTPKTYNYMGEYGGMYFFDNDELTNGVFYKYADEAWVENGQYVQVDNPSGYKYVAIPFAYYTDISSDTMTMTVNREITDNTLSFAEYVGQNLVVPKVVEEVSKLKIPTKTSELTNDSGFLTEHQDLSGYAKNTDIPSKTSQLTNDSGFITADDIPESQAPDLSGYAKKSDAETWTFTLKNGTTVTKKVVLG